MNKVYKINELNYELIENYKEGFIYEDVLNKATDYFNDFDYIVGDWSYGKLRLKGFCDKSNKLIKKYNDITNYKQYIKDECAYDCKYFVLKKKEELSDDIRTSASQLGMLDSVITAYQYNPEQAISSLRKHLSESMKREENNRIQKQHNSLQNVGKLIENEILNENKKIEDIAGFKGKNEGCIMGISTSELLPEDEEKQMKLKVILDLIRFNNKGEK